MAESRATSDNPQVNQVIDRLTGVREHSDYWTAPCPAHDDQNPSLSISTGDDDRVLLKCHAGCETPDVVAAMDLKMGDLFAGETNGHRKEATLVRRRRNPSPGEIAETYDYRDEHGSLIYQAVRFEPKDFRQRRPASPENENGEWTWNLQGVRRVPYGLPELHAADPGETVLVCEGERDVHKGRELGFVATTNAGGAGKWKDAESEYLRGRAVVVIGDNDEAGRRHAKKTSDSLHGKAASVKAIQLPDVPEGGDLTDFADAGGTAEDLRRLINEAPEWIPSPEPGDGGDSNDSKSGKRRNQTDRLIDYALDSEAGTELFVDQVGAPHVLVDGEAVPLNTRAYNWLRSLMWENEGISVSSEALKTAAGTLAAFAINSGEVRELHTRAAYHEGALYYQLGPRRVVRVDRDGYTLDSSGATPVFFRSIPNLKPLPDPQPGGTLDLLEIFVKLKSERDRRMFAAYMVTVVLPHIPRPILQTTGVQGGGKTTAGRFIKRTVDPSTPETMRADPRDFLQKVSHCHIAMLDNLNSLPEWAVDMICRLVTGEGDSKRKHYTDDDDVIYELRRAVILNGINAPTERGDAQDRTLPVELERIPDGDRRSEESLWTLFDQEHGRLLGAIFGCLSATMRRRETLQLHKRPRLADWGEYAAAAYEALGWSVDTFFEDWEQVVQAQNQGTLDGSPVAQAVLQFMESRNEWTGLASDLHAKLEVEAEELNIKIKHDKMWPKSARWLWRRMKEVLPLLAAMGVEATNDGNGKTGTQITLKRTPTGGGDGGGIRGGIRNESNTTSNTTGNPAEESAIPNGGNRGINYGLYPPSTLSKLEEKAGKQGEIEEKTHRGRELPISNTSNTSNTTSDNKHPLTAEQVAEFQRLRAEGKSREQAGAIVRGEENE